jgi:hypothetical protein
VNNNSTTIPKPHLFESPFIWNHSHYLELPLFPFSRIIPFHLFKASPCHITKCDELYIGGKPPRSSDWTDDRLTTRIVTACNFASNRSNTRTESLSCHTQCRSRVYERRVTSMYRHARAPLSTVLRLTDAPINSHLTLKPCLVKAPGPGRSAVCTTHLPGEAYRHCCGSSATCRSHLSY